MRHGWATALSRAIDRVIGEDSRGMTRGCGLRELAETSAVEVWVDDPDDFEALYAELRGVPAVTVEAVPSAVETGDQGSTLDLLVVACSSGAVTTFLQIVKTLIESRGPSFVLKMRQGRNRLVVTSDNIDEVAPAIRKLLDGS
jgi:Effector Associated Constant Component 1